MSDENMAESNSSSPASDQSDSQLTTSTPNQSKRKPSKPPKPRLTASQKNTNHKDAENKRRGGIRDQYDRLAAIVPECEGQARSELVMLHKTAEFLVQEIDERRRLVAALESNGLAVDQDLRLTQDDWGGSQWSTPHYDQYEALKAKKGTQKTEPSDQGMMKVENEDGN